MPHESRSSPREIRRYLGRFSGPLLDRIPWFPGPVAFSIGTSGISGSPLEKLGPEVIPETKGDARTRPRRDRSSKGLRKMRQP